MARDWTQEEFGITDKTPVVDIDALENKCEILQKQLDIAVEAFDSLRGICSPERAEQALKQIKELER